MNAMETMEKVWSVAIISLSAAASVVLLLVTIDGLFLCHLREPSQKDKEYAKEVERTLRIEREYWKRHPDEYKEKLKQTQANQRTFR